MQRYLYQKNELMDCGTSCRKVFLKYAGIAHLARHKGSFMSDQSNSSFASDGKKDKKAERVRDIIRTGEALAASEVVSRFGSANAEFIKGYSGIDNETGQKFAKGLASIAKGKINPEYAEQNLKQQAGYSAEVATTSRDNAEAIISKSRVRTSRSDDLPQYGKNHTVVDRVQILDGQIIEGSQSQMKFVGNPDELLKKIAREDGEFARYRGTKLELPSEQYEDAVAHCRDQAKQLRLNAERAQGAGKPEVAAKLRREADNYDQLASDVTDSGMTTEQAIFYRKYPGLATARDIAQTSHRAGIAGAKMGAVVGLSISVFQNGLAVYRGDSEADAYELTLAVLTDTGKAAAMGYGGAFAGSAIKGTLQQSSSAGMRAVAKTNLPALVVSTCVSLSGSIKRYVQGEISEADLLTEVGEKGAGMLSSSMMAAVGQLAIPIPVVGAVIGGMVGATLSSFFYQSALDAARGAQVSREVLERTRAIEGAARARMAQERAALQQFIDQELPQLRQETQQLLAVLDAKTGSSDDFAAGINRYAELLGVKLAFNTQSEFNAFIASGQTLRL